MALTSGSNVVLLGDRNYLKFWRPSTSAFCSCHVVVSKVACLSLSKPLFQIFSGHNGAVESYFDSNDLDDKGEIIFAFELNRDGNATAECICESDKDEENGGGTGGGTGGGKGKENEKPPGGGTKDEEERTAGGGTGRRPNGGKFVGLKKFDFHKTELKIKTNN